MTTPTNEEVRRQFEAWAVDRRMSVERDERHGYYLDDATQDAWQGYQAALSSPAVVALVELAKQYASECAECEGRGHVVTYFDPYGRGDVASPEHRPCGDCADIRAAIAPFTAGAGHVE